MKKKILIITLLILSGFNISAQLNGTYTIGGASPDYPTFAAAVSALTSSGVSGAVIFNVRTGNYQEKISIPAITGASSSNSITFQSEVGDSSAVVLADSATSATGNNFTLQLTNADYFTFRKMTIQRNGTGTYANVIEVSNGAVGNKFQNNRIIGVTSTVSSTTNSLVYSASGTTSNDSNNVFSNNYFENGSYGMYYNGPSGTVLEGRTSITNNIFRNQYARSIYMLYQSNPTIAGNDCMTNSVYTAFYGIYISSSLNGLVAKNKVIVPSGSGYGIYLSSVDGTANTPFNVANNMIHLAAAGTAYGMYLSGCTYTGLYYNSVNLTSTGATTRCLYITGTTTIGVDVVDNVLVNTGGGHAYYVVGTATAGVHLTNYNCLFTTGATLGFWTTAVADLAAFQAASGMETNSVSADPIFYSAMDLHVSGTGINGLGVPIAAFNTDIDGEPRSGSTPDIGSDEFTPLSDNIGVVALVAPALGGCGDSSTAVAMVVKNFGLNSQSNIPFTAEITGAVTQTLTGNYLGTLATNAQDTFYFSQTIVTVSGGTINLKIYSALASDQYRTNDTINASKTFYAVPNAPVVVSPQQQCDNNVNVSATPDTGNVLFWYDQPGGNLLFIGNSFTPQLSSDTTFYVSQHLGSGSSGCMRISECGLGGPDFIEIENLSGVAIDATGWVAVVSNSYTDINLVNTISWNLGLFNPGEIQYKSDGTNDQYWGNNILWNPGSKSWAMIVDNAGTIIDFVAWGWTDAEIQTLSTTVNGFPVTIGPEWTGNAPVACAAPNSVSRTGSADNNNTNDFACEAETKGTQNINLSTAFNDCGVGLCGSIPVPVEINLVPGITVTLGNDTVIQPPFSFVIDAGAGYTSYQWSTAETTQSITVTTGGIYWVVVTGGPNGCSATDSILINYTVGVGDLSNDDGLFLFPNPASGKFVISGSVLQNLDYKISLMDFSGRDLFNIPTQENKHGISVDISGLAEGIYMMQLKTKLSVYTRKLIVQY